MAKQARLEARVSADVDALLKRAAEIEGRSLSDVVVTAARQAAEQTVVRADVISLSDEDQLRFAQALIDPPPLAPGMERAIDRYTHMAAPARRSFRSVPSPWGNRARDLFCCGVEALERYSRRQVSEDIRRRLTASYVALRGDSERICGFYTLSACHIALPDLPAETTRELPPYPAIPAVRVGRLAVDCRRLRQHRCLRRSDRLTPAKASTSV